MKKVSFVLLVSILITGLLLTVLMPKKAVSETERRKLAEFPELSAGSVFDGKFFSGLETYLSDHFCFRDTFRQGKALTAGYVFMKKDDHNVYVYDDSAIKMEYPQDDRQINSFVTKTNKLIERFFTGIPVYFSIIPDKNYFAAGKSGHLSINYTGMVKTLTAELKAKYIDIFPYLELEDYYATDTHWRQEKITDVATELSKAMGNMYSYDYSSWKTNEYNHFYGVFYSRAIPPLPSDTLKWLSCKSTDSAVVTHTSEKTETKPVYDTGKLGSRDSYEIFLSGATPLCTIENPLNPRGKRLLLFRDSFGSSIVPLLINGYSKITLVDTRYIHPLLLPKLLDLKGYDGVLFLYSASTVNQSDVLKGLN